MERDIAKVMESIPGFKFHPSDEELLLQHLRPKIEGTQVDNSCVVPEVKVCQYDPWHLPKIFHELSVWKSRNGTREWTFLCPRKRKYSNSQRLERTTPSGQWKVTGAERNAKANNGTLIGIKKTLVFHKGRVPRGKRTNWVMYEYHLNVSCLSDDSYGNQLPYVACRIKLKKDNKGMNTDDYPTEDSDRNSPYTIDVADYLQFNEDNSSSSNTPASTGDVYHDATADQYAPAYQHEVTIDSSKSFYVRTGDVYHDATADQYAPAYQHEQLDNGVTPEYNAYNGDNAFYYGDVPPSPPLFSPSSLSYCDSYINWDYVPKGYNDYN